MDSVQRLLIEQAFKQIRSGYKDLVELLGAKKADAYMEVLLQKGKLGTTKFEQEVLKSG